MAIEATNTMVPRHNKSAMAELDRFADLLASNEQYTYKKNGLGRNAIKEIVFKEMVERRRRLKQEAAYTYKFYRNRNK